MSVARIGLIFVALVASVAGVYSVFRAFDERSAPAIVIEDAAPLLIVVDVRGAVVAPGVFELPLGARLQDAVEAGGGFAPEADLSTINLARRIRDGEIIEILRVPEAIDSKTAPALDSAASGATGSTSRININTAPAAELDLLPGIGQVTAERIIEFRELNGPYRSIDDLEHVEGISTKTIGALRDLVTTAP